ncbi:MAG: hypothetical protein DRP56_10545 [Planctomycetota bacterium]|nr:MAG: hypothetical protein DRP56_10545 [Planctomycetota bacterium]
MANFNEMKIGQKWDNETILGFFTVTGFLTISERGMYSVWTQPASPDEAFTSPKRAAYFLKDCQRIAPEAFGTAETHTITDADIKNLV